MSTQLIHIASLVQSIRRVSQIQLTRGFIQAAISGTAKERVREDDVDMMSTQPHIANLVTHLSQEVFVTRRRNLKTHMPLPGRTNALLSRRQYLKRTLPLPVRM
jgi:hypothetical protein